MANGFLSERPRVSFITTLGSLHFDPSHSVTSLRIYSHISFRYTSNFKAVASTTGHGFKV